MRLLRASFWQLVLLWGVLVLVSAAVTGSVLAASWTGPNKVPGSDESYYVDVEIDSFNRVHVVWIEAFDKDRVYYMRGTLQGSFVTWDSSSPQVIYGSSQVRDTSARVVVGSDGTVYITVLPTSNELYLYYNSQGGQTGAWVSEFTGVRGCRFDPAIAVDKNGGVHVICSTDVDGSYVKYAYRRSAQNWTNEVPVSHSTYLCVGGNLVVDDDGNVHVAFEIQESSDDKPYERYFYYSRGTSTGFGEVNMSRDYFGNRKGDNTAIAIDRTVYPNVIYAGYIHGSLDDRHFRWQLTINPDHRALNWTWPTEIEVSSHYWSRTSLAAYGGKVHIISRQRRQSDGEIKDDRIYYHFYQSGNNPGATAQEIGNNERCTDPRGATNGAATVAVWIKGYTDNVWYNILPGDGVVPTPEPTTPSVPTDTPVPTDTSVPPTPTPTETSVPPTDTPTPINPEGWIEVDNGEEVVGQGESVSVKLHLTRGQADQYKIWDNFQGSENDAFVSMPLLADTGTHTVNRAFTRTDAGETCYQNQVYGYLYNSSNGGLSDRLASVPFWVDPDVAAEVGVVNPGPGDPLYTGTPFYNLSVEATTASGSDGGECSGIQKVSVGYEEPTQQAMVETEVDLNATNLMPIAPVAGTHEITVKVTDGAGHTKEYPRSITLVLDEAQLTVTNEGTVSVEDSETGQVIPDNGTTNHQHVNLRFSNVQGSNEQPWGICGVNSTSDLDITTWADVVGNEYAFVCKEATVSPNGSGYNLLVEEWDLKERLNGETTAASGGDTPVYLYTFISGLVGWDDGGEPGPQEAQVIQLMLDQPTVYLPLVVR
ncbi:MAG: hypothetical protein HC884_01835 [Chloroflexaceae bacterium]|nr:hypothetical protein [Chloroflexaceae bacterium]